MTTEAPPQLTVDRSLIVWTKDGQCTRCEIGDLEQLESAMERWLGGAYGPEQDSLVRLHNLSGSELTVVASFITSWLVSDRASRERHIQIQAAFDAEEREFTARYAPGTEPPSVRA